MDIKPKIINTFNCSPEYELMEIIFNPSKNSPPDSFIKTLQKRYDVYYKMNNVQPKVGFNVQK